MGFASHGIDANQIHWKISCKYLVTMLWHPYVSRSFSLICSCNSEKLVDIVVKVTTAFRDVAFYLWKISVEPFWRSFSPPNVIFGNLPVNPATLHVKMLFMFFVCYFAQVVFYGSNVVYLKCLSRLAELSYQSDIIVSFVIEEECETIFSGQFLNILKCLEVVC